MGSFRRRRARHPQDHLAGSDLYRFLCLHPSRFHGNRCRHGRGPSRSPRLAGRAPAQRRPAGLPRSRRRQRGSSKNRLAAVAQAHKLKSDGMLTVIGDMAILQQLRNIASGRCPMFAFFWQTWGSSGPQENPTSANDRQIWGTCTTSKLRRYRQRLTATPPRWSKRASKSSAMMGNRTR